MVLQEYAFNGLVGPTHQYGGLSEGNLASTAHAGQPANPRAAALEGLAKLRALAARGVPQGVLPPHERPLVPALRRLGFSGTDADVLFAAVRTNPRLLRVVSSASAMWAANAATVAPSADTPDGRVHFTPANLVAMLHRSFEPPFTRRILRRIFGAPELFAVHEPLPAHPEFSDEGAANHTRFVGDRGGIHLFAWGRAPDAALRPERFPARQSRAAGEAVARLHGLSPTQVIFWQQDPVGIDAGAFHTDVLAVGARDRLLVHERAFVELPALLERLRAAIGERFRAVIATEAELPLADAIAAYPFNSELVPLPDDRLLLVAPLESRENAAARRFLERAVAEVPELTDLLFVDVNGSMRNGGGPACLRLRIPLTDDERAALGARVLWSPELDA
ncbi:MAG: N-succinylarginine dihydrolase, partial [Pseudomonadota bacterium]